MPKNDVIETVDEERTVDETVTDTPTTAPAEPITYSSEPVGGATADEDEDTSAAGFASLRGYEPTPEQIAQNMRANALQLAAYPGNHEAKEPIASVLARAEAYRTYMETGETGIVA